MLQFDRVSLPDTTDQLRREVRVFLSEQGDLGRAGDVRIWPRFLRPA